MSISKANQLLGRIILIRKLAKADDTFEEDTIYQVLGNSITEGKEKEDFKFADENSYRQAVEALAQGNLVERAVQDFYPFEPGETYSWNIGYSDWERLLTVYW